MSWQQQIEKECRQIQGVCGVAIKHLTSGDTLCLNAEQVFPAASLIKLFILWDWVARLEAKEFAAGELVVVQEENKVPGFGVLKELHGGLNLTLLDLATLMIIISDNVATNMLIARLGMANINQRIKALGAEKTVLQRKMMDDAAKQKGLDNFTSPSDVMMLLERVATGASLCPESARCFVDILKRQQCNNKLPALLPAGTVLAHKTGDLPGTEHDTGIMYFPSGPVIAVVLTKELKNNNDGIQLIGRIGKCLFDQFS